MNNIVGVILAAGIGKRMHSKYPKVLHKILGKPILYYVIKALEDLGIKKIIVVTPKNNELFKEYFKEEVLYVIQKEPLGTANALLSALPLIGEEDQNVLVTPGDNPILELETLRNFTNDFINSNVDSSILTANAHSPYGLGRIVRDKEGEFQFIVEEKDATSEQLKISEINTGTYLFKKDKLLSVIRGIENKNKSEEFYLTDIFKILQNKKYKVKTFFAKDILILSGINNRKELSIATGIIKNRILDYHMLNGVTIIDPASCFIDEEVVIGNDTILYPGVIIEGNTVIGSDCEFGPFATINNAKIGKNVKIKNSVVTEAIIEDNVIIGPYAYIRPGTQMSSGVKAGTFVEIKASKIGKDSKVSHLSYVGDAEIGERVNVGAGVITCNYDGFSKEKQKTVIEDDCFIGANNNLVAPIKIRKGSYTATGSTITEEVPENSLGIARAKQINKEGWVLKKKNETK